MSEVILNSPKWKQCTGFSKKPQENQDEIKLSKSDIKDFITAHGKMSMDCQIVEMQKIQRDKYKIDLSKESILDCLLNKRICII